MKKDLIISVYNEEISWLKKRNYSNEQIFAYKKFERFDYDYVELLPNVGRESHTYIHHIVKNYNKLESDYLMLLQGDPFPHIDNDKENVAFGLFNNEIQPFHKHYPLTPIQLCNTYGRPLSRWNCEMYTIWDELFGQDMPKFFIANYGAQHLVHKNIIKGRSLKFWEKALELHFTMENVPWKFEIIWNSIFDLKYSTRF